MTSNQFLKLFQDKYSTTCCRPVNFRNSLDIPGVARGQNGAEEHLSQTRTTEQIQAVTCQCFFRWWHRLKPSLLLLSTLSDVSAQQFAWPAGGLGSRILLRLNYFGSENGCLHTPSSLTLCYFCYSKCAVLGTYCKSLPVNWSHQYVYACMVNFCTGRITSQGSECTWHLKLTLS